MQRATAAGTFFARDINNDFEAREMRRQRTSIAVGRLRPGAVGILAGYDAGAPAIPQRGSVRLRVLFREQPTMPSGCLGEALRGRPPGRVMIIA